MYYQEWMYLKKNVISQASTTKAGTKTSSEFT